MYTKHQPPKLILIVIKCPQLLNLLTADDRWKKPWNFHVQTLVFICAKFQLFSLFFVFVNWFQVLTADDSWYEFVFWNFHVYTKGYMYAKFQLSRLI